MIRLSRSFTASARLHPRLPTLARAISTVRCEQAANVDVAAFRSLAYDTGKPLHMKGSGRESTDTLRASDLWFQDASSSSGARFTQLSDSVTRFADHVFPFELVYQDAISKPSSVKRFQNWLKSRVDLPDQLLAGMLLGVLEEADERTFFQLMAPLRLLQQAVVFNAEIAGEAGCDPVLLYIAQSSLSELPPELRDDVPTPEVVLRAGKGDIYASSIWLGTEPTFTPLHRDPNPNLFCQLHARKRVRLLAPQTGEMLFFEVQARIRQQASSRIRTAESMMQGLERQVLADAVWGDDVEMPGMLEATVEMGDRLFIPKGWWHSIRSVGDHGELNGSVNWWFR